MARQRRDWRGFGDWLLRERAARGWNQDVAVAELERLTGTKVTRNWLSQLENGAAPSDELMRGFERLFGDFRPSSEPRGDFSALVTALDRQTAAILELARVSRDEVAALRQHVDQTVARLFETAAGGLAQGEAEGLEWGRQEGYVPEPVEPPEKPPAESTRGRRRNRAGAQGEGGA